MVEAGLLTTVQDLGRWGWQSRGVSVSGAMDLRALRLANALVGNGASAAALEVTLVGPTLCFHDRRLVAICGAEFDVTVSGRAAPMQSAFRVEPGDELSFGSRRRGARAYVAIGGGCAVPAEFGSRATQVAAGIGGYLGRPLTAGDRVPLGPVPDADVDPGATRCTYRLALPGDETVLRVVPGPQDGLFGAGTLDALQAARFRVGRISDRMGYRLEGSRLPTTVALELLSTPTVVGGLQVPHDGHPILLMADRQTTGGYPILATVISADLGLAGQLAPGDRLSFQCCSVREAISALIAEERALMAVESLSSS